MKNVLIVEDNEKHMEALYKLLLDIEDIKVFKAYNMTEACYMLSLYDFTLFIVDIILDAKKPNDVSGIELVKHIRDINKYQFTPIIFTTTLEDPQLCAYRDLHCYQYIEKPYDEDYVVRVVKQALKFEAVKSEKDYVYFKKDGVLYSVRLNNITHIEINRRETKIYTLEDCLRLGYQTTSQVLERLGSDDFIQCNRGTIVNRRYIETVDLSNRYVKLYNVEESLELGPSMRRQFKGWDVK